MTDTVKNDHAKLYAKLANVMAACSRLPKNGYNAHFKYRYVLDEDVADAVRGGLAKENVAFLPSIIAVDRDGDRVTLEMDFIFACGDTGATIAMAWRGEAVDKGDKGISKAVTLAQKYFLIKTFILSAGDEADPDANGEVARPARQADPPASSSRAGSNGRVYRPEDLLTIINHKLEKADVPGGLHLETVAHMIGAYKSITDETWPTVPSGKAGYDDEVASRIVTTLVDRQVAKALAESNSAGDDDPGEREFPF